MVLRYLQFQIVRYSQMGLLESIMYDVSEYSDVSTRSLLTETIQLLTCGRHSTSMIPAKHSLRRLIIHQTLSKTTRDNLAFSIGGSQRY
jgi:hypothetical protein